MPNGPCVQPDAEEPDADHRGSNLSPLHSGTEATGDGSCCLPPPPVEPAQGCTRTPPTLAALLPRESLLSLSDPRPGVRRPTLHVRPLSTRAQRRLSGDSQGRSRPRKDCAAIWKAKCWEAWAPGPEPGTQASLPR